MAVQHSPAFQKICESARSNVREVTADQVKAKLDAQQKFHLIDVRDEWARSCGGALSRQGDH